jgi:hypothetical protein
MVLKKRKRNSLKEAENKRARKAVNKVKRELAKRPMLELFLMALTQLYPLDKLAPGIVLSALPNGGFYAAVCRYDLQGVASPTNPGAKQTLVSVQAGTALDAITALAQEWQGRTQHAQDFAGVTVRRHGKLVRRG